MQDRDRDLRQGVGSEGELCGWTLLDRTADGDVASGSVGQNAQVAVRNSFETLRISVSGKWLNTFHASKFAVMCSE